MGSVTQRFSETTNPVEFNFLDHIIMGKDDYYSLIKITYIHKKIFEDCINSYQNKAVTTNQNEKTGETGEGDIINQYVIFTKVCNEQVKLYGRTKKAILETIRICKDRNVLRVFGKQRKGSRGHYDGIL